MMFSTLQIFQLQMTLDLNALQAVLPDYQVKQCDAQSEFNFGTNPLIRGSQCYAIAQNECLLMNFTKMSKNLPSSVVREELNAKVSAIEINEGRKVGRKEKSDIKEEIVFTLRARAFDDRKDVQVYVDNKLHLLVLNTTNGAMTEQVFKQLQTIFGSFPMTPMQAQLSPSTIMTDWLMNNSLPAYMETGSQCIIVDQSEDKAKADFKNLEPLSEDVTRHLEQGMTVQSLALRWSEKLRFTLNDDITLTKVKWDDVLVEQAFNDSQGGEMSDLDASFAIMSSTIRLLWSAGITQWFEVSNNGNT